MTEEVTGRATWRSLGADFAGRLMAIRAEDESVSWYPFFSMSNVEYLDPILPSSIKEALVDGALDWDVLDVGAADGDLGYFFESRGSRVDFLDNASTNYNGCHGIQALASHLGSESRLIQQDIDRQFTLDKQYDFALALGLLYHLRNPMYFLMTLAEHAERMVLSTRVAKFLPNGEPISEYAIGYLLYARESYNDPTNFWTLSPKGLELMLKRCGWSVKTSRLVGAEVSNPVDDDADQRMFVYCERVENWRDLQVHHDF